MKSYITIITFAFIALYTSNLKAQDTIVKLSGEKVIAKIIEITPTEVKYKKNEFLDGPTYVESKSNIGTIKFKNGITDIFNIDTFNKNENKIPNDYDTTALLKPKEKIEPFGAGYQYQGLPIDEKDMQKKLLESNNKQIIDLIGKAKREQKSQLIGVAAIPLGVMSLLFILPTALSSEQTLWGTATFICATSAVYCTTISIVSRVKRSYYNRQAVKIYNEKF